MSDRDAQILKLIRQLTPEQRDAFADFLRLLSPKEKSENPSENRQGRK